jgi:Skp family chaperone for outer membrane proteins
MFSGDKMKSTLFVIAALFATLFAVSAGAQTTTPPVATTPATPTKMAIIDSDEFADTKTGVKKLLNALTQVDNGLTTLRQELVNKNNRLQALAQKANAGTITQAEADEADNLKRDIQRGQEDGQRKQDQLTRQFVNPVLSDLSTALQTYAKQRGFDLVVDISKVPATFLVVNESVDITSAFIADFNAKNPVAATAAAPTKP